MSKNNKIKREAKKFQDVPFDELPGYIQDHKIKQLKPIETIGHNQERLRQNILYDDMVIATGYAGTGKTWLATAVAADLYLHKHFKKLVLTRPSEECGESLGFLPGELDDKFAPYVTPFKKALTERLGGNKLESDLGKKILPYPLQYMRGETFDDAIILCDEAQNITITQMKMLITRPGMNSKLIITGDTSQSDLNSREESGLEWLVTQITKQNLSGMEVVDFTRKDCVRSQLCRKMLDLIENEVL